MRGARWELHRLTAGSKPALIGSYRRLQLAVSDQTRLTFTDRTNRYVIRSATRPAWVVAIWRLWSRVRR
jgi:hypothetical protein